MTRIYCCTVAMLFSFLLTPITGRAASFDCTKATSRVEKLICSESALSKLDEDLAIAYGAASAAPGASEKVRRDQRKWLEMRNACSDSACIKSVYARRLDDLSALADDCRKVTDANFPAYEDCVEKRHNMLRTSVEKQVKALQSRVDNDFGLRLTKSQENWERYADEQCALQWSFVRGGMGHTYWMACMNGKYEPRLTELTDLQEILPDKQN